MPRIFSLLKLALVFLSLAGPAHAQPAANPQPPAPANPSPSAPLAASAFPAMPSPAQQSLNTMATSNTATAPILASANPTPKPEIGSPAPPLRIAQWIKGNPVSLSDGLGKNLYVVEFWATWCPPCRESIPKLSILQARYRDRGLTVVGVTDEHPSVVKPFVEKQGSGMAYNVAIDSNHQTWKSYMVPFGGNGIPHAFLVDAQGRIVWHGNPHSGLEEAVDYVYKLYDNVAAAQKTKQSSDQLTQYLEQARKDPLTARPVGLQIVQASAADPELAYQLANAILTDSKIVRRDTELAAHAAKAICEATKNRKSKYLALYARALLERGSTKEAIETQQKAIDNSLSSVEHDALAATLKTYQSRAATTPIR